MEIDCLEQNNKDNKIYKKSYIIFTQLIFEVIVFIGGSVALGLYLDKLLKTKCLFLLILLFIFAFVPIYNLIRRVNNQKEF